MTIFLLTWHMQKLCNKKCIKKNKKFPSLPKTTILSPSPSLTVETEKLGLKVPEQQPLTLPCLFDADQSLWFLGQLQKCSSIKLVLKRRKKFQWIIHCSHCFFFIDNCLNLICAYVILRKHFISVRVDQLEDEISKNKSAARSKYLLIERKRNQKLQSLSTFDEIGQNYLMTFLI